MKTLIVGSGISGLATSIALARKGHQVSLIEREEEISALGSGITLIGPALRAMDHLGVLSDCVAQGYPITEFEQRTPSGELVSCFTMPSATGEGGPGMMGMTRPGLHRILLNHADDLGVQIRTGIAAAGIEHRESSVSVLLDGTADPEEYDLLVGADGLNSWTREENFGDISPTLHEQVIYRVVLERPADLTREAQFVGHPSVMVGFTPTGENSMYMYCLVPAENGKRPTQEEWPALVRNYLEPFGGVVAEIRDQIVDPDKINFTRFRTIVVPKPWWKGRTVLVGDSAHCTTPHLAAGASMCLEDAVVLAEELETHEEITDALEAYTERRYDRCKYVVETSAQLSHWGVHPEATGEQVQALIQQALGTLAGPF
jgi:2-polyprenyl-6-methoxyphenol hydroxylase-like FAD-dependent oxidoreductase